MERLIRDLSEPTALKAARAQMHLQQREELLAMQQAECQGFGPQRWDLAAWRAIQMHQSQTFLNHMCRTHE
jgi:hypothetical protein